MTMIARKVAGRFAVEIHNHGFGERAVLKVSPTQDDGRLFWDCASGAELYKLIDQAIDELASLKVMCKAMDI